MGISLEQAVAASFLATAESLLCAAMKTLRLFVCFALVLPAVTGLSGCGGYPMTVESRTGAESRELTIQDRIRINRNYSRSRASGA